MAKKHIGELLYNDSRELDRLLLFVRRHQKEFNPCNQVVSSNKARRDSGVEIAGTGCFIIGYIELLQNQVNETKTTKEKRS